LFFHVLKIVSSAICAGDGQRVAGDAVHFFGAVPMVEIRRSFMLSSFTLVEADALLHKTFSRHPKEDIMKRALLVIDVQNEYFTGKLPITHPNDSFANILKAMDAAEKRDLPVVVVQHTFPQPDAPFFKRDTPEWQLHPEIAARRRDLLIEKNLPGSFTKTELEDWLKARGAETVVIAGYMTHMCCDTTAREASHRGFGVEFLSDATGTLALSNEAGQVTDEELHRSILVAQQMLISEVITTEQWILRI
jgi:nicotinamidase-related amidase